MSPGFDDGGPLGERLDLVGFGEVMVLLQPDPPETLAESATWRVHVAGAEFNACAAAAALGARVELCTRLGDDPPGRQIRRQAAGSGVGLNALEDASTPTGLYLKDALPDGERRVHYYRAGSAASQMDQADAERGLRGRPRVVLISGLTAALGDGPASMMIRAVGLAREIGVAVVLDVNLRPGLGRLRESVRVVEEILPVADIVVIGASDGDAVFGTSDPHAIGRSARAAGAHEIVVTAGPDGSWWQDSAGSMRHQATLADEVVDPVGAGDAFTGAYIAGRLTGLSAKGATWLGSTLAARVVAVAGDTAGLPRVSEAPSLLQRAAEHEAVA